MYYLIFLFLTTAFNLPNFMRTWHNVLFYSWLKIVSTDLRIRVAPVALRIDAWNESVCFNKIQIIVSNSVVGTMVFSAGAKKKYANSLTYFFLIVFSKKKLRSLFFQSKRIFIFNQTSILGDDCNEKCQ